MKYHTELGDPPEVEGILSILRETKDGHSFGDHPTPTQEGEVIPWWKKRGIESIEKQSQGGSTKTKGGNKRVNKASPAPSRKGGSKKIIPTQLTKLGVGASGTLQLIKRETGDIRDCGMSNDEDDLRKKALGITDDIDMSNEPVKTTPLVINNQGLNDELRCFGEQLAMISSITSDSRESGRAGNG